MTFIKTLSTLSLALTLQAGALVAAAVVLSPSDAAAATHSKAKPHKKSQKKGGKPNSFHIPGDSDGPTDRNDNNKKGGHREKTHGDPFVPPSSEIKPVTKPFNPCGNCH
jgi:hypothetical protein